MMGQWIVGLEEVGVSCAVSVVGTLSMTMVLPFRGSSQITQAFSVLSCPLKELSSKEVGSFPAKHRLQKINGQALRRAFYMFTCSVMLALLPTIQASGCKQLLPSL